MTDFWVVDGGFYSEHRHKGTTTKHTKCVGIHPLGDMILVLFPYIHRENMFMYIKLRYYQQLGELKPPADVWAW